MGLSLAYLENILKHLRPILSIPLAYLGHIFLMSCVYIEHILNISLAYPWHIPGTSPAYLDVVVWFGLLKLFDDLQLYVFLLF